MPVEEDENGTLIFNSRDLCLLEFLPELISAGVSAMKIEGRMKGVHYLAGVLRVYRAAIDAFCADPEGYCADPAWLEELTTVSHRGYTTGFLLGDPRDVGQSYQTSYHRSHRLVGVIEEVMPDTRGLVAVRNRFHSGDDLELVGPEMKTVPFQCGQIMALNSDGDAEQCTAVNPNQRIIISLPESAVAGDMLRTVNIQAE